jgi:hypothetical protein
MAGADSQDLLESRLRVPEHVVHRDFGDDTVILNLESGNYHGLNRTAATMVTAIDECPTVAAAVERVALETGQPGDLIERDVLRLCGELLERGLLEADERPAG